MGAIFIDLLLGAHDELDSNIIASDLPHSCRDQIHGGLRQFRAYG